MKKAIAMKCNQEQFDAVKDKLVGCDIDFLGTFANNPYLVNNYIGIINCISNVSNFYKNDHNREIHETWNEEIFLNACGIETERIFKGSELQVWGSISKKWMNLSSCNKYRIKPANLIKKQELESQILELQNQLKNL